MQNAFAFGIAKNVNGLPAARRAASAYQLGGGAISSPTAASSTSGASFSTSANEGAEAAAGMSEQVARAATLPRVASSPIAFSISADAGDWVSRSPVVAKRGKSALNEKSMVYESQQDRASLLAVSNVADAATSEVHLGKRGTTVDKTNPFIGYFQTGQEEVDDSMAVPQPRTVSRAQSGIPMSSKPVSAYYSSVLLAPQKRFTEWLGTQSVRFPPFFKREEKSGAKSTLLQDPSFLPSLQLAHLPSDADGVEREEKKKSHDSTISRAQSLPTIMETPAGSAMLKTAPNEPTGLASRFEQDFDVLGCLGEGGQGAVYKVRSKVDGCLYAVKKVVLPNSMQRGSIELDQALREVRSMATMPPHANVVRYHTAWLEEDRSCADDATSTQSVRGSDLDSVSTSEASESDSRVESMQKMEEDDSEVMNENESSFSLDFSSNSISFDQYSTPGFQFAESSEVGNSTEEEDSFGQPTSLNGNERINARAAVRREPKVKTPTLNLYIQMELCGSAAEDTVADSEHSFNRLIDRLTMKNEVKAEVKAPTPPPKDEAHSNLTAWLRSSYEMRSRWSAQSATHLEGLKLFLGVAQGVAHMHSSGVIHRDLKPDNIFIHGDVAKIGDFGLSKSIFSDATRPRNVQIVRPGDEYGDHTTALGTFTYASPEQLGYRFNDPVANATPANRAKSAKYSTKSDIFALGVILLEMCYPFSTMMERSQVLTGIRHGVVPQRALQHFPAEMTLVLRMTAIDPAERPTSEEVCEQIRRLLNAAGVTTAQSALDDLRDLQSRLAVAVRQLRDRSQTTLQLEMLVSELNDKVQSVGVALA